MVNLGSHRTFGQKITTEYLTFFKVFTLVPDEMQCNGTSIRKLAIEVHSQAHFGYGILVQELVKECHLIIFPCLMLMSATLSQRCLYLEDVDNLIILLAVNPFVRAEFL